MAAIPQDLLDRIRELERRLRAVEGRANIRPAMDQVLNGKVKVGEGGTFEVAAPNNATILGAGRFASTGRYGMVSEREDGSGVALEIGGNSGDAAQMIRLYARGQYPTSPMIMDDAHADGYLGRPWVPIPMSTRFNFTNTTWLATHTGWWWAQHAVLHAYFSVYAPASTTAEARLMVNRGDGLEQIGPTIRATNTETYFSRRLTRSEHQLEWGQTATVLLQAQRTSGSGSCAVFVHGLWGTNTRSGDEAA